MMQYKVSYIMQVVVLPKCDSNEEIIRQIQDVRNPTRQLALSLQNKASTVKKNFLD